MKRKISRLQSKSEKARAKSYRAKTKAEDAKRTQYSVRTIKIIWDTLFGKKTDSDEPL